MRKDWIAYIGITLTFTFFFSVVFYLFVLKPRVLIPNKLLEIKNITATNREYLLQSRLALMEFAKLDINSNSFNEEKNTIISNLTQINKNAMTFINNNPLPERLDGSSEDIKKINDGLISALDENKNKNILVLESQKEIIDELTEFDKTVANIYMYEPKVDLDVKDTGVLKERVQAAISGLDLIETNLTKTNLKINTAGLLKTLNKTQEDLEQLEAAVDQKLETSPYVNSVIESMDLLKITTIQTHKEILSLENSLNTITTQTNIMLHYDKINNEVSQMLKTLPNRDLGSIF